MDVGYPNETPSHVQTPRKILSHPPPLSAQHVAGGNLQGSGKAPDSNFVFWKGLQVKMKIGTPHMSLPPETVLELKYLQNNFMLMQHSC